MDINHNIGPNNDQNRQMRIWMQQIVSTGTVDEALVLSRISQAFEMGRRQGRYDVMSNTEYPTAI
jgi:hypothetical protein